MDIQNKTDSSSSVVCRGQQWKHRKTGKTVTIAATPANKYGDVRILHKSGRQTVKQQHYFLYEYERI